MEWIVVVHEEEKYVELVTKGVADGEGSMKMAISLAESMRAQRINKAILDHRNIDYIIGSSTAFNDRPKAFNGAGPSLHVKIAEIIRPEHMGHFKYLETMFTHMGHNVCVFEDRDKALAWLLTDE
jgi:hypothetical protein